MTLQVAAYTDQGRERDYQEDNYCIGSKISTETWDIPSGFFLAGDLGTLLVVADGMGGLNAGEVASEIAIKAVKEYFTPQRLNSGGAHPLDPGPILRDTVLYAHGRIVEHARLHTATEGMGTTLVLAWVFNNTVYVGWSGDSRCYLLQHGKPLRQLNEDHSYVQELVNNGAITPEEAFFHPNKHIITQSLGEPSRPPEPGYSYHPLGAGDRILLCSDGLNTMLQDDEIERIFSSGELRDSLRELVDAANASGGYDNITVVACEMHGTPVAQENNAVATQGPQYKKNTGTEAIGIGTQVGPLRVSKRMRNILLLLLIPVTIAVGIGIGVLIQTFSGQNNRTAGPSTHSVGNNNAVIDSAAVLESTRSSPEIQKGLTPSNPPTKTGTQSSQNATTTNASTNLQDIKKKQLIDKLSDISQLKDFSMGICKDKISKIIKEMELNGYDSACRLICDLETKETCGIQELQSLCDCSAGGARNSKILHKLDATGSAVSPQGGAGKAEVILPHDPAAAAVRWQVTVWSVEKKDEGSVRAACFQIREGRSHLTTSSSSYDMEKNKKRFKIIVTGFKDQQEANKFKEELLKKIGYNPIVEKAK